MTEKPDYTADDTWDISGFFFILLRQWWVILTVFLAALVVALALWLVRDEPDPSYEATTKLLVVTPASTSAQFLSRPADNDESELVPTLSITTQLALASARDLLQLIIDDLNLQDAAGTQISAESLDAMLDTTVGFADPSDALPILTTTVRGDDPKLVARIATTWAEKFAEKNGEIVALAAAGSYELAVSHYDFALTELNSAVGAQRAYEQSQEDELLDFTLSSGLNQLELQRDRDNEALALEAEMAAERLRRVIEREELRVVTLDSSSLAANEIELTVALDKYLDFLGDLEDNRAGLVSARALLEKLQEALAGEDPILILKRNFSDDALLALLAGSPTVEQIIALDGVVFEDEVRNALFDRLNEETNAVERQISVLEADIDHLTDETTDRLKQDVDRLSVTIDRQALYALQFDRETERLLEVFDRESTLQAAQFASATVIQLSQAANSADHLEVKMTKETDLRMTEFDQEIEVLGAALIQRTDEMQKAEIAKADGAGSIRLVEAAVVPSAPMPVTGPRPLSQMLLIAAVIGLVLGSTLALAVHGYQLATTRHATPQAD